VRSLKNRRTAFPALIEGRDEKIDQHLEIKMLKKSGRTRNVTLTQFLIRFAARDQNHKERYDGDGDRDTDYDRTGVHNGVQKISRCWKITKGRE
jgi:hypothetical protein